MLVPPPAETQAEPTVRARADLPHDSILPEPTRPAPTPDPGTAETDRAPDTAPAPIDTERARQDFGAALSDVEITMYSTTWCPVCEKARTWLRTNKINYTEHDVEADESANRACKLLNPRCSVPTIDVDGDVLVGFSGQSMGQSIARATQRRLDKRRR